jgi:hypothetical protein
VHFCPVGGNRKVEGTRGRSLNWRDKTERDESCSQLETRTTTTTERRKGEISVEYPHTKSRYYTRTHTHTLDKWKNKREWDRIKMNFIFHQCDNILTFNFYLIWIFWQQSRRTVVVVVVVDVVVSIDFCSGDNFGRVVPRIGFVTVAGAIHCPGGR